MNFLNLKQVIFLFSVLRNLRHLTLVFLIWYNEVFSTSEGALSQVGFATPFHVWYNGRIIGHLIHFALGHLGWPNFIGAKCWKVSVEGQAQRAILCEFTTWCHYPVFQSMNWNTGACILTPNLMVKRKGLTDQIEASVCSLIGVVSKIFLVPAMDKSAFLYLGMKTGVSFWNENTCVLLQTKYSWTFRACKVV